MQAKIECGDIKHTTTSVVSPPTKLKCVLSTKRKSASLPSETVEYLKSWMMSPEHIAHPYPTEQEKSQIMGDTGIELKQLTNWFVNNRKRYWKPRVEASLQKQAQAQTNTNSVAPTVNSLLINASARLLAASSEITPLLSLETGNRSTKNPVLKGDKKHKNISFVAADNLLTFVPSILSPRPVSEASSAASESESVSTVDDECSTFTTDEIVEGDLVRTETISIHVLKSSKGDRPTPEDVSISLSVPSERVLRTFDNCALTYRFPVNESQNRKKILQRREVEIMRMKRHYLKLFLVDIPRGCCKRKREDYRDQCTQTPRVRYNSGSLQLWRDACRTAINSYDDSLPSLEEATQLFGYRN